MEKESFEDTEVAKLMNEVFVSIKVDREERPDIDNIYMTVCQMMTGSGGWPLTIIMTPEGKPFFAGTYIPKQNKFGRIGMLELIPRIKEIWEKRNEEILSDAEKISLILNRQFGVEEPGVLNKEILEITYRELAENFDSEYGGFGDAPEFPNMRNGGIYDHLGFGFHRYSTDSKWILPHFEKMLYDQALLAMAYIEAYQATRKEIYYKTAREIFDFVLREMRNKEGGFYSALDSESEGEEGKFYLLSRNILDREEAEFIIKVFNIKRDFYLIDGLKIKDSEFQKIREKLFRYREKRIRPNKDDKILTDWNGLMIAALAKGAGVFNDDEYARAASLAVDFIFKNLVSSDGKLLHRYRDGEEGINANLDDYAFLIWGLIELYEASFDVRYLESALKLNSELVKHFWDEKMGGFYFTAENSEKLLFRQKEIYDGAVPSGNSVAMLNMLRLSRMIGNTEIENKAGEIANTFYGVVRKSPHLFTQFMIGLEFKFGQTYEVVIAGNSKAEDTGEMLKILRREFIPNKVVIFRPSEEELPDIVHLAEFTKLQKGIDGKATAYVCVNYNCKFPTTNIDEMLSFLSPPSFRGDKSKQ